VKNLKPGLVSIISPGYNSARFYPDVIESVRAQTYAEWELLVAIDEGTKDNTAELINGWNAKDPRIKLVNVPSGRGLALARNYAMSMAEGQYIAFLDSDDMWMSKKLESQLAFMKKNNLTISCTSFRRVSEDLSKTGHLIPVPTDITYETLLVNNVMGCLTVMFDQRATGLQKFQETKHEDYLLWLSILKKGHQGGGLNEDLARYRIVKNSRSANKLEMIAFRWKILTEHQGLSAVDAAKYLMLYGITSLRKYARF
jgi:teichuronic acid biosynthesis glycosyltransferase TuaG